jgi:peptidase C13-like protein
MRGRLAVETLKGDAPLLRLGDKFMGWWSMGKVSAAVLAVVLLALAPGAVAQQQGLEAPAQQDPFGGRFGSWQVVQQPQQAANLAQMMGSALTNLQPQRPGHQDVYLITASLWDDPVFQSEATHAEAILRRHLGAEGRSILLSAGDGTANRQYPDASPDNLAAAIGKVGGMINPAEDLVVVFITTHGSHDGAAALRENNHIVGSMHPVNLRDLLNNAGIYNRVVIISACFSGAFIAPLMDDNTIVITAAAADRSSFGCQPERDWTFFGDAYFNHALSSGAGMLDAFDQAKRLVEQWEHEQNLTPPSNPQRFVGGHAAQMLRQAEQAAR